MPTVTKVKRPWIPEKPKQSKWSNPTYNGITNKDYSKAPWRHARQRQLDKQPLCEECYKNGRLVDATVVDHKVPVRLGGEFMDEDNHVSLCESCHNRKSAKERYIPTPPQNRG